MYSCSKLNDHREQSFGNRKLAFCSRKKLMVQDSSCNQCPQEMFLSTDVVEVVLLFRHSGPGKERGWKGGRTEGGDLLENYIKRNHACPTQ